MFFLCNQLETQSTIKSYENVKLKKEKSMWHHSQIDG